MAFLSAIGGFLARWVGAGFRRLTVQPYARTYDEDNDDLFEALDALDGGNVSEAELAACLGPACIHAPPVLVGLALLSALTQSPRPRRSWRSVHGARRKYSQQSTRRRRTSWARAHSPERVRPVVPAHPPSVAYRSVVLRFPALRPPGMPPRPRLG